MNEQKSGMPWGKAKIAWAILMAALFFLCTVLADVADARTRRQDRHGRPSQKTAAKKRAGKTNKNKRSKAKKVKRGKKRRIKKNPDDKVALAASLVSPGERAVAFGPADVSTKKGDVPS